jgi:RNA polymerase sigma-70 factor (ECF subfamily)
MRAWQSRERFRIGTNLAAWLMTILRNCFLSDMRRLKRVRLGQKQLEFDQQCQPANQEQALRLGEVASEIAKMPREQGQALLMVSLGTASYAEAAARCGCAEGTVKSRVSRARQRLAKVA